LAAVQEDITANHGQGLLEDSLDGDCVNKAFYLLGIMAAGFILFLVYAVLYVVFPEEIGQLSGTVEIALGVTFLLLSLIYVYVSAACFFGKFDEMGSALDDLEPYIFIFGIMCAVLAIFLLSGYI